VLFNPFEDIVQNRFELSRKKALLSLFRLFNQLLQYFPPLEFAALVKKHSAERAAEGFSCRAQLVAMLFCQLAHADSPGVHDFIIPKPGQANSYGVCDIANNTGRVSVGVDHDTAAAC
jgi:hypothetical protein